MQELENIAMLDPTKALVDAIGTIKELNQTNVKLIEVNTEIHRRLQSATKACNLMTQTAIYYDSTYAKLPADLKKQFDEIGRQVIEEYKLDAFY